jgi:hypothetical protein
LLLNLIIYITAPRLSEKDADTLSKALYYSKKAYEEALLAKESSVRTENAINEFIKAQSSCNESNENSNGESKGHTKKKQFWYSVSTTMFPGWLFLKNSLSNEHLFQL